MHPLQLVLWLRSRRKRWRSIGLALAVARRSLGVEVALQRKHGTRQGWTATRRCSSCEQAELGSSCSSVSWGRLGTLAYRHLRCHQYLLIQRSSATCRRDLGSRQACCLFLHLYRRKIHATQTCRLHSWSGSRGQQYLRQLPWQLWQQMASCWPEGLVSFCAPRAQLRLIFFDEPAPAWSA